MNLPFLYVKKYPGVIDDSEDPTWFMSKEYDGFIKQLREFDTESFIKTILNIFEMECPDSHRLLEAFTSKIEKQGNTLYVKNPGRKDVEVISILHNENTYFNYINNIEIKFYDNISDIIKMVFSNSSNFQEMSQDGILIYKNIGNTSKIKKVVYDTHKNTLFFEPHTHNTIL